MLRLKKKHLLSTTFLIWVEKNPDDTDKTWMKANICIFKLTLIKNK